MSVKCVCPECQMSLTAPTGAASVTCPICDTPVAVPAASQKVSLQGKSYEPRPSGSGGVEPPRPPLPDGRGSSSPSRTASQRRRLVFGLLGGLAVLWLGGGIAAALYFLHPNHEPAAPQVRLGPTTPAVEVETRLVTPPPLDPPPLTEEQKKINAAIARGIPFLKAQLVAPKESDQYLKTYPVGLTALIGLTLLECDVPANDPSITQAATTVRNGRPKLVLTYELATAILFLDRLGDKKDRDLIRAFALRLVAGQRGVGTWSYTCPLLNAGEEQLLLDFLTAHANGKGGPINVADFTANLQECSVVCAADPKVGAVGVGGDNSNAQFAVLALWVARRHDLPVQPALVQADRHFRGQQRPDGGWDYYPPQCPFRASMTCAGLLALAVGRSVDRKAEGEKAEKDPAIEKGFRFLAPRIGPDSPRTVSVYSGTLIQADSWGDLYYLWSL